MLDAQQIQIGAVLVALSVGAIVLIIVSSRNPGLPSFRENTGRAWTETASATESNRWREQFTAHFEERIGEDTLDRLERLIPNSDVITDVRRRHTDYSNVDSEPRGGSESADSPVGSTGESTIPDAEARPTVERLENDLRNEIFNHIRTFDTELESEFEEGYEFPSGEYQLYLNQVGNHIVGRRRIDFEEVPTLTSELQQSNVPLPELVDLLAQLESERQDVVETVRSHEDEFVHLVQDTKDLHAANRTELEKLPDPLGSWLLSVYYPGVDGSRPGVDVEQAIEREKRRAALDDLHRCSFEAAIDGAAASRNRARDLKAVIARLKVIFQRARRGVNEYEFDDFDTFSPRFLTWQFLEALAPKVGETYDRTYEITVETARLRFQEYMRVSEPSDSGDYRRERERDERSRTDEARDPVVEPDVGPDRPEVNEPSVPDISPTAAQRVSGILTQVQGANGERVTVTETETNISSSDDETRSILQNFLTDQDDLIEEWTVHPTGTGGDEIVSMKFRKTAEEPGFDLVERFEQVANRQR